MRCKDDVYIVMLIVDRIMRMRSLKLNAYQIFTAKRDRCLNLCPIL